jgi:hypothetical protein
MTATPRIDEIRAREKAATPGHWGTSYDGKGTYTVEAQPRLIPDEGNVNAGTVATLSGEHGDGQTYANARFTAHARDDVTFLLDRVAELEALVKDPTDQTSAPSPGNPTDGPIHEHFELSYADHLVAPRVLLQSMPTAWQEQFVGLLRQFDEAFQHVDKPHGYKVTVGKWMQLDDMDHSELHAAGIVMEGEEPDAGPGLETRYHREYDGAELTGQDYGFVPGRDPLPHYRHAYIEPRLGGGE